MRETLAVIGTGYVGLVSGTCFAEVGNQVTCVDIDEYKIKRLQQAEIPIYEPGLEELVRRNLGEGRLRFTTDLEGAVEQAELVFIAVGTPSLPDGGVDMGQVKAAALRIAPLLGRDKLIVIKSTVPVGTARMLESLLRQHAPQHASFEVVSNPEFLREGSAVRDTFHMDRVVIGSARQKAADRIAKLHEPFAAPVLITDRESAELIKYASNAFLAAKISFINEMANLCDKVGANVESVAEGMGMDHRIGPHFLQAGIGYGGSCFPKDTQAQLRIAENVDYDFKILRSVIEVNRLQRELFAKRIIEALDTPKGSTLAILGLSFKPNTDDVRDAPALDIIRILVEQGVHVHAYDPVALVPAASRLGHQGISYFTDPYEAVAGADAAAVMTEWQQIKRLDLQRLHMLMNRPILLDGRNCFSPAAMAQLGFEYISIGRPSI
ncbi:UDP-glucose/GDP-mannose dehydrogenase family protein [Paenibacillus sp. GD4]|uniref:UDP-glucose dehydrogenase family protein n=1 Tax=Paenibacillus sp. GD4 TaxID=3068890 RepID=UPI002796A482|nr:UDP-glucose/GDP-mannose dehydrogenase family protein [Paenibacillus sp. GD4]MDQ1913164.1 UDP-glucose/GDP-mannose dehydrogenase family protein [Paenibacillus sp. GD4]